MTIHLPMNHYGCAYYFINEDPYIYEIPDNEKKKTFKVLSLFSRFLSSFLHSL